MKLGKKELFELKSIAKGAALHAGEYIQSVAGKPIEIHLKSTGTSEASQVVTMVDLKAQEIILDFLSPCIERYDLGLLTEESQDDNSRFEKDYFWCIDPLDGTLPFTEGKPGYAVVIALVSKEGVPQIGLVYDPVNNVMYEAVLGGGAQRNGKPFKIDEEKNKLTFLTDRSFLKYHKIEDIRIFLDDLVVALDLEGLNEIYHGGAALHACWMVENTPAAYFKFPKDTSGGGSFWDYAASACIVKEAGCVAGDIHGRPLNFTNPKTTYMNEGGVLMASSKELAEEIQSLFKKLSS